MTKTITGYFVDPENSIAGPRTIEKSLEGYYALLRCDTIDIVSRQIGGERFDIICDDEGLLKDPVFISARGNGDCIMLVGPIFVVKFDGKDDVTSLSAEELDFVDLHSESGWFFKTDGSVHVARTLYGVGY